MERERESLKAVDAARMFGIRGEDALAKLEIQMHVSLLLHYHGAVLQILSLHLHLPLPLSLTVFSSCIDYTLKKGTVWEVFMCTT